MHNPQVPETLEGWSVLHQMFGVRWSDVRRLPDEERRAVAEEAHELLVSSQDQKSGPTALVHMLGHKADLMLVHFRRTFEDLAQVELAFARTRLHEYLEPRTSYVSIVELGMYEMTGKVHQELAGQGLKQGSPEYEQAFDEEMSRQRDRVTSRLFLDVPARRYVCFYPMNKRRGEHKNWYSVPFDQRAAMMREHGMIGRHYAGQVTQIISGSIGYDDWEWGVDLFADDPIVFKKLIYEMRFDEASAIYAEFGPFYVGLQFGMRELPRWIEGQVPGLQAGA